MVVAVSSSVAAVWVALLAIVAESVAGCSDRPSRSRSSSRVAVT